MDIDSGDRREGDGLEEISDLNPPEDACALMTSVWRLGGAHWWRLPLNVDTDSRSGDSYPDTSPGPGQQNIPS